MPSYIEYMYIKQYTQNYYIYVLVNFNKRNELRPSANRVLKRWGSYCIIIIFRCLWVGLNYLYEVTLYNIFPV